MPQPEDLRALMADHKLTSHDIARFAGVNPATARCWIHDKGPKFKPCPDDAWDKILRAVGELPEDPRP